MLLQVAHPLHSNLCIPIPPRIPGYLAPSSCQSALLVGVPFVCYFEMFSTRFCPLNRIVLFSPLILAFPPKKKSQANKSMRFEITVAWFISRAIRELYIVGITISWSIEACLVWRGLTHWFQVVIACGKENNSNVSRKIDLILILWDLINWDLTTGSLDTG